MSVEFSQLSNEELGRRLLALLDAQAPTDPLKAAARAVEVIAAVEELRRRGVPLLEPVCALSKSAAGRHRYR